VIVHLFSYGTLRQAEVQRALFGRTVPMAADALAGFKLGTITIADPAVVETSGLAVHRILDPSGNPADRIEGVVLSLSESELAAADAYETRDYARIAVRLESGIEAFAYIRAGEPS
jgi:hypothetical protein